MTFSDPMLPSFRRWLGFHNPFKSIVLGRCACLGKDLFELGKFPKNRLVNMQKARVDVLMKWMDKKLRPKTNILLPFLAQREMSFLIAEEERLDWLTVHRRPRWILMDSFAELTDQAFLHRREGWTFCAHYTDIQGNELFRETFESLGLLPVEKFENTYENFFNWLAGRYPGVPVLFLHFPTENDPRKKFAERAEAIKKVINDLSDKNPLLHSISIDSKWVTPHPGDDFPYHYGAATYEAFLKLLPHSVVGA